MLPAVGEVLQQSFARDAEDIAIVAGNDRWPGLCLLVSQGT